jgi:hypothetical protein
MKWRLLQSEHCGITGSLHKIASGRDQAREDNIPTSSQRAHHHPVASSRSVGEMLSPSDEAPTEVPGPSRRQNDSGCDLTRLLVVAVLHPVSGRIRRQFLPVREEFERSEATKGTPRRPE